MRNKREKIGKKKKNRVKEEKSGRKGKIREVSFTLPLLTDRAGYATTPTPGQSGKMTGQDDPTISCSHLIVKLNVLADRKILMGELHP